MDATCRCIVLTDDSLGSASTCFPESVAAESLASLCSLVDHAAPEGSVDAVVAFTAAGRAKYGSAELSALINTATARGLLAEAEKERLHEYRERFRNAYGHADSEKTFGEVSVPIQAVRVSPQGLELCQSKAAHAADFLPFRGLFQALLAEREALPYFLDIDDLARKLRTRVFGGE